MNNQNSELIKKIETKTNSKKQTHDYLPIHKELIQQQLTDCIKTCSICCNNLFNLSLLIPSAPWVYDLTKF